MTKKDSKKILIVEDDKFIAEVYMTKLSLEGFEVLVSEDGESALEKIKDEKPDLVLLDVLMPKLNGIEVLEKINQDEEMKNTSVIILTNASERDFIKRASMMGAVDYLIKSNHTPDEVMSVIKKKLKK